MRASVSYLLAVLAVTASSAVWAGSNAALQKAERLYDDLDYDAASVALLEASKSPRNDLKTVLRILELQGMIATGLDQKSVAVTFFKQLLTLSPTFELDKKASSSKQRTLLGDARRALEGVRPIKMEALPAQAKPGEVESVSVKIASDPLNMAKRVRFMIKVEDESFKEKVVSITEAKASAKVESASVSWYAELWGEHDATLAVVGSMDKPIVLRAPEPEPLFSNIDLSGMKPLALAAGGAALVAGGVGTYFGYRSRLSLDRIQEARDQATLNGQVTMITMRQAETYQNIANFSAVAANLCWAAGLLLAGGGVTLWLLEPQPPAAPGAAPSGVRLIVSGEF